MEPGYGSLIVGVAAMLSALLLLRHLRKNPEENKAALDRMVSRTPSRLLPLKRPRTEQVEYYFRLNVIATVLIFATGVVFVALSLAGL
jgi:hypothetical protein